MCVIWFTSTNPRVKSFIYNLSEKHLTHKNIIHIKLKLMITVQMDELLNLELLYQTQQQKNEQLKPFSKSVTIMSIFP